MQWFQKAKMLKLQIGFKALYHGRGQGLKRFESGAYNRGWKPLPQLS
jgi:hypothetical protein